MRRLTRRNECESSSCKPAARSRRALAWGGSSFARLGDLMSRISIEVTKAQHARLKSLAEQRGLSLKALVLSCTLGDAGTGTDLAALEAFLEQRIARSKSAGASRRSVGAIFRRARQQSRRARDA